MRSIHTIEQRILLECAQPHREPCQPAKLPVDDIDWRYVYRLASRHGVLPLLHGYLAQNPGYEVPAEVLQIIENQSRQLALANLFQTRELLRVLDLFEAEHIEVMPFKGPTLGYYLFGNLVTRTFGDLDLLIHRHDFDRVKQLLLRNGYDPFRELTPKQENQFVDTQMGFEFVRHDKKSVIEVHWSFLNRVHAFHLKPAEVWLHKTTLEIEGRRIFMFSPAYLLVYLCAHGSKSFWTRLRWISDVAELVRKHPGDDFWNRVYDIARDSHSERMVNLGLSLAGSLLEAPLPTLAKDAIARDPKVGELFRRVTENLFSTVSEEDLSLKNVAFHFAMREHFLDRLPYLKHVIKLWLNPSAKDKAFVRLPESLQFLYLFLKPFRLLGDRLRKKTI